MPSAVRTCRILRIEADFGAAGRTDCFCFLVVFFFAFDSGSDMSALTQYQNTIRIVCFSDGPARSRIFVFFKHSGFYCCLTPLTSSVISPYEFFFSSGFSRIQFNVNKVHFSAYAVSGHKLLSFFGLFSEGLIHSLGQLCVSRRFPHRKHAADSFLQFIGNLYIRRERFFPVFFEAQKSYRLYLFHRKTIAVKHIYKHA